jgi:mediator of RNA polymerase II transcription subunit 23
VNVSEHDHSDLLHNVCTEISSTWCILNVHWFFVSGDRIMDYMKMDDISIGMFWVVSYTMAQPACETVINWLSSAGVAEMLPGQNPQSTERLMLMREVSPLPMSLLSGFSMNLSLKLAYQMEDSLFVGQVL